MRTGKDGQLVIDNKKELMQELETLLPFSTVHLIGPSGSGKTELVESLVKEKKLKIDELKIVRLQGVSSEDFRIPVVKTIKKETDQVGVLGEPIYTEDKTVELINLGIFQDILDNPDKTYLVFFDEITRADATVAPLLFGLLERRINGIKAPNMWTICSSNSVNDSDYINNFDFKDSALRRRQVFVEYIPSKEDIVNFTYDHDYHPMVTEVLEALPMEHIISHKSTKEFEQDTQLGSWAGLNNRWKTKNIKSYKEAAIDMQLAGCLYFNHSSKQAIAEKMELFHQIAEIDIQKEIIENYGLDEGKTIHTKKGNIYEKTGKELELKIRTKTFIVNECLKDYDYLTKFMPNVLHIFSNDVILFLTLIEDFKNKFNKIYKGKAPKGKKAIDPEMFFVKLFLDRQKKCKTEIELAKAEDREPAPDYVADLSCISKIMQDLSLADIEA